ncbi:MAG TPA: adenosine deaminase [Anaerolineaceae bacterium]|nr:adenosine deaminase [Anaerolineaceae bacterium]HPN52499.1 adenosine deaminase [Anaerolineaceae bacterium]
MQNSTFPDFQALPKIDLHRHLEGSLRLRTLLEIARESNVAQSSTGHLRPLVQVLPEDEPSVQNFLSKFQTLRLFYRSPEIIARLTREAVEDAASDNLVRLELRFTPVALARSQSYDLGDVMDWVCSAAMNAAREFNISVGLIASVNRHEAVELAEQVAGLAVDRRDRGVCGLDLAGNEAEFPGEPFRAVFIEAQKAGLKIAVHAGEWSGPENVRYAIEEMHADRIGHGVRVVEDDRVMALAAERQTPFEVCITSNVQSGVVPAFKAHPLPRMLRGGINALICTDDPSISQITLSHEYHVAASHLKIQPHVIHERSLAAARASFINEGEKEALLARLR